jgi:hypothetical protein
MNLGPEHIRTLPSGRRTRPEIRSAEDQFSLPARRRSPVSPFKTLRQEPIRCRTDQVDERGHRHGSEGSDQERGNPDVLVPPSTDKGFLFARACLAARTPLVLNRLTALSSGQALHVRRILLLSRIRAYRALSRVRSVFAAGGTANTSTRVLRACCCAGIASSIVRPIGLGWRLSGYGGFILILDIA